MRRVLVTGGTGFVGSHTIEVLLAAGWTVRAVVRNPTRLGWLNNLPLEIAPGNLENSAELKTALKGCTAVVHCAGLTKALRAEDLYRVNAQAVANLVNAAREAGVQRFVHCSSQAAAGPSIHFRARTEDDLAEPISDYGRSKLAGEQTVVANAGPMQWIIIRPPAVFGPRDEQFVPLFRAVCDYGIYPAWGSGKQLYSLVYVKDLATVLSAAASSAVQNELLFAGAPDPTDWAAFSALIADACQRRVRRVRLPVSLLKSAAPVAELVGCIRRKPALLGREKIAEILADGWVCSSEKLEAKLGLRCDFDLGSAIRETITDYQTRGRIKCA